MTRTVVGCAVLVGVFAGSPVVGQEVLRSALHDVRVVTVADDLEVP